MTHVYAVTPVKWPKLAIAISIISGACMILMLGLLLWYQTLLYRLRRGGQGENRFILINKNVIDTPRWLDLTATEKKVLRILQEKIGQGPEKVE